MTRYLPLERYGLIGNLETCALVGADGSIDWCPFPHLESASVFARLLDADRGGHFAVRPSASFDSSQHYRERTNVLETTFRTALGDFSVVDFMPIIEDDTGNGVASGNRTIYRQVTCERGTADIAVTFAPRFDYARAETTVELMAGGVRATGNDETLFLSSSLSYEVSDDGSATATRSLAAGESEWFVVCYGDEPVASETGPRRLEMTLDYWRGWAHTCNESECVFAGPWHDLVVRSGLVLKLLTHHETGAVAAAPTTSLPEEIGGVRNWDYRYTWLRDGAFTIQALSNLHHTTEATAYFEWFLDLCHAHSPEEIQPLYGLHGDADLEECELDHLEGYRNSTPVRVGNGAAGQIQLDTYGELLLAVDETVHHDGTLTADDWESIRGIVEHVREVWDRPDAGIWEVRGGPQQFVFSKVMCWVALDRGIAIATDTGFDAPIEEWRETQMKIKAAVCERGYSEERGTFVQSFDDPDTLDATGLLLPVVGFLPFDDPRIQETIDATIDHLTDDGLVSRYDGNDGLAGEEGAFVLCSCWLVDALALSGRVAEARDVFADVLQYVSPPGLLAEEIDRETGRQVGNFPQAFSHIGLINSALYLGTVAGRDYPSLAPVGLDASRETPSERDANSQSLE